MKKILKYTVFILCLKNFSACKSDNFLEVPPKNLQTEGTAFKTYDNFQTYAWGFYTLFEQFAYERPTGYEFDAYGGALAQTNTTNSNFWAYQRVTEAGQSGAWNFSYIRQVNTLLDNVDLSAMTQADKEHWRSVGLFFRSLKYFELLSKFGDVPWIEHVLKEADTDIIFGKRTPRDEVAKNILRDLNFAEQHIKAEGDGANTINVNVVRALISRFGLFEGTWRKYHGLSDADTYLRACSDASDKIMNAFPVLHHNYDELFNSEDLSATKGILLYKRYEADVLTNSISRTEGGSGIFYEMTKETVDGYLCTDGRTIANSPLYNGDKTAYDEFRNRDRRLLFTAIPPYRVFMPDRNNWRYLTTQDIITRGKITEQVTVADSVLYREYLDLMTTISTPDKKYLPTSAWTGNEPIPYIPRFRTFTEGFAVHSGQHGYKVWKYYNKNARPIIASTADAPLFRVGEVMLNYAEAKWELGAFDQGVADRTINVLRVRAGVASMNVGEINGSFDPNRDQEVDPVLWEIRRERRVELLGEGFAFDDIRRWKKGAYLNKQPLGRWVNNAEYNNTLRIQGYASVAASADKEGYIIYCAPPPGWLEHYYLYPLPITQLVLNPQLVQNPGYATP
ncbi:MAG: RagB/SusD family nutrient uptake outer membrane protein [Chitinophagaceae bacterium]|nr:RagB/SusD family nutrient uptake outer membrane protein [Chitinophagaceae bacterium]